jgi:hypothetical protein
MYPKNASAHRAVFFFIVLLRFPFLEQQRNRFCKYGIVLMTDLGKGA